MQKRILSHLVQCILASGALVLCVSAARAETDASVSADAATVPAADASAPAQELGAVTVTAQKREQDLQKVPVAVAVVNAQQLEANGVRDFVDLNRIVPELTIKPAENPVNASLNIRGVGTFAFSIGVEPSVAEY